MNQLWTKIEKQFIRSFAHTMKDKELAIKISTMSNRPVTINSVRKQRQKMGIVKAAGRGICKVVNRKDGYPSAQVAQGVIRKI